MKHVKKIMALVLALALGLSLTGCMSNEETTVTTQADTTTADATTATAAEDDDDSSSLEPFDASAYCDEYGWYLDFDALAVTTLPELKGIVIPYDEYKVEDSEIQEVIDAQLENYAETKQVTDRAVVDGDTLNIAYEGSIDGEVFSGGTTTGTNVTIGVTSYIDDFLEQLIGHMPGETFDIEVTFPDPYTSNTDLSGKDAVFKTTINYITETVTPEFTDAFVEEKYSESEGWKTTEDMWNGLVQIYQDGHAMDYLEEYIVENSEVSEVPEIAGKYWRAYTEWYANYMCAYYSVDMDTYLASYEVEDLDGLYEKMSESVNTQVNADIIFDAIAQKLEYVPSEEDVTEYFDEYYGENYYEYYKQNIPQATLLKSVINDIVLNYVYTLAELEPAE